MQIILVGINHKTAPIQVRQQLACDESMIRQALHQLRQRYPDGEFVLLSTCNRVECYAVTEPVSGPTPQQLGQWLAEFRSVEFSAVQEHLYYKKEADAVRHLFAVTASLDSMVIGESQITAQVKESYKLACRCQTAGKIISHLFHDAFRTAKKIISQTSIAVRRVSVAGVAVGLARQLFGDIKSANVVIVGAGQMAELLIEHFQHVKCSHITIVSRSEKRRCQLAERRDIAHQPWDRLDEQVACADIVVGAASAAEGYLFDVHRIQTLMGCRQNRVLLVVDIAVPRCFDPAVGEVEDVCLHNIDDLASIAQDNIKLREGDLEQAIEIICEAVSTYMEWFLTQDVGPLMGRIKKAFEQIREIEMQKFFTGPRQHADCRCQMDASVGRVINKLSHCVLKSIDAVSKERGPAEAEKLARSILDDARQIISEDKNKKKNQ